MRINVSNYDMQENSCYNCTHVHIFNLSVLAIMTLCNKMNIINQICLEMDSLIYGENGQVMDDASGNNTEVNFHCCLQLQGAYRNF